MFRSAWSGLIFFSFRFNATSIPVNCSGGLAKQPFHVCQGKLRSCGEWFPNRWRVCHLRLASIVPLPVVKLDFKQITGDQPQIPLLLTKGAAIPSKDCKLKGRNSCRLRLGLTPMGEAMQMRCIFDVAVPNEIIITLRRFSGVTSYQPLNVCIIYAVSLLNSGY